MLIKNLINFLQRCESSEIAILVGTKGKDLLKTKGYKFSLLSYRLEVKSVKEFIEILDELYGADSKMLGNVLGRNVQYGVNNEFKVYATRDGELIFNLVLGGIFPDNKVSGMFIQCKIREERIFF